MSTLNLILKVFGATEGKKKLDQLEAQVKKINRLNHQQMIQQQHTGRLRDKLWEKQVKQENMRRQIHERRKKAKADLIRMSWGQGKVDKQQLGVLRNLNTRYERLERSARAYKKAATEAGDTRPFTRQAQLGAAIDAGKSQQQQELSRAIERSIWAKEDAARRGLITQSKKFEATEKRLTQMINEGTGSIKKRTAEIDKANTAARKYRKSQESVFKSFIGKYGVWATAIAATIFIFQNLMAVLKGLANAVLTVGRAYSKLMTQISPGSPSYKAIEAFADKWSKIGLETKPEIIERYYKLMATGMSHETAMSQMAVDLSKKVGELGGETERNIIKLKGSFSSMLSELDFLIKKPARFVSWMFEDEAERIKKRKLGLRGLFGDRPDDESFGKGVKEWFKFIASNGDYTEYMDKMREKDLRKERIHNKALENELLEHNTKKLKIEKEYEKQWRLFQQDIRDREAVINQSGKYHDMSRNGLKEVLNLERKIGEIKVKYEKELRVLRGNEGKKDPKQTEKINEIKRLMDLEISVSKRMGADLIFDEKLEKAKAFFEETSYLSQKYYLEERQRLVKELVQYKNTVDSKIDLTKELNQRITDFNNKLYEHQLELRVKRAKEGRNPFAGAAAGMEDAMWKLPTPGEIGFDLMQTAVTSLEDSLLRLFQTGKFGFKEFATVILQEAQRLIAQEAVKMLLTAIMSAAGNKISGIFSGSKTPAVDTQSITQAMGGVFGPRGVYKFARGGLVTSPTFFRFANGTGLMGEAGAEAIMPLSRGKDGKLGVKAEGSTSKTDINQISFYIKAWDSESVTQTLDQHKDQITGFIQSAYNKRGRSGPNG